ncbi:MAG: hypothetical protein GTO63_27220 [Anaerolineae bacterium]|nr:hypothetical protein [Anaerolineae bacterium]NIN98419.1 hypothetical protein [Anaerolineae bacterium]NIQ81326.1 hypothetical protein [Anaerolineae bacterium]
MKKILSTTASILMLASFLAISPISAKGNLMFKANGKIDHYADWLDDPSSVIVGGSWNVKVKDGVACFSGYYRELNLDPEVEHSPEGTVDHFRLSMVTDEYWLEDDTLVMMGEMHVDKKMWIIEDDPDPWVVPPGKAPQDWIEDFIVVYPTVVRVDPSEMTYDFWDDGVNTYGTTLTYHNYS